MINNQTRLTCELRRITSGLSEEERKVGQGNALFDVQCSGNAESVLGKTKDILTLVLLHASGKFPDLNEWRKILPEWFLERCSNNSGETISSEDEGWDLDGWLDWFRPDERYWFWWNAQIKSMNSIEVSIEVDSYPFPWGSLEWLFMAAGAVCIDELI